jgi:hypothetical protein
LTTSKLLLTTGDLLEVKGSIYEVTKTLENAARSSAGTLARLEESGASNDLAVNPLQVVTVRPGD